MIDAMDEISVGRAWLEVLQKALGHSVFEEVQEHTPDPRTLGERMIRELEYVGFKLVRSTP